MNDRRDYLRDYLNQTRFGGLRDLVLQRDGYQCTMCGEPWSPTNRRILVHHLDHDPQHNTMENLKTLCRRCHPAKHAADGDWTPARRALHSQVAKASGVGLWMQGRPHPAEASAKAAEKMLGRRHSPEAIEKMREAKRRWWARQPASRKTAIGQKRRAHRW